jgi:methylmalonyl-CoA/ethylmalonyl-CoA epimerase
MNLSTIGQIALSVSDADTSQVFYGETLQLTFLYRFGDLVFFDCGGVRLMLEGNPKEDIEPSDVCIYFNVSGIEDVYASLQERGVAFDDRPHLVARMPDHELWMAFFRDPDGHLLAIMEEKR